jgi:hypothetical protein
MARVLTRQAGYWPHLQVRSTSRYYRQTDGADLLPPAITRPARRQLHPAGAVPWAGPALHAAYIENAPATHTLAPVAGAIAADHQYQRIRPGTQTPAMGLEIDPRTLPAMASQHIVNPQVRMGACSSRHGRGSV